MSDIPRTSVTWEAFFYIPILPERVEFEYTERDNWVELYVQDSWGTERAPRLTEAWYKRREGSWLLFYCSRATWASKKCMARVYRPVIKVRARRRIMGIEPSPNTPSHLRWRVYPGL
jgi:hypothetical protein